MPSRSPWRWRTWHSATLIIVAWLAFALGWSWFLIASSFEQATRQRLEDRAQRVVVGLRTVLPASVTAATTPSSASDLEPFAGEASLLDYLSYDRNPDPQIAYIMLWDPKGKIIAHTNHDEVDTRLDPAQWPALAPDEDHRFVHRNTLPWGARPTPVLEVTVPVRAGGANGRVIGYVSLAVSDAWIQDQFWRSQTPILLTVAAISALGAAGLLLGVRVVRRKMRQAREAQEQQIRARTSLLTERGMLASVLAHEVRSPLTALRFNLYSLRSLLSRNAAETAPRQVELTDLCEREIRRLDLMLNDFLQRTQIISPPSRTSVNQVVREALDFLGPALERRHIRVITHLDATSPHVSVNADELRQVLLNLSANAQDAMPKGGTLAVSTLAEESSVTLLVRDSGVGIPQDLQMRIFEPFFTTKPQGSGLGLALVRRVISGAGGTIFCESAPNEGTTFRIVLPRADDAPPPSEEADAPSMAAYGPPPEEPSHPPQATPAEPPGEPTSDAAASAPPDRPASSPAQATGPARDPTDRASPD